jgi:hypothetical protein
MKRTYLFKLSAKPFGARIKPTGAAGWMALLGATVIGLGGIALVAHAGPLALRPAGAAMILLGVGGLIYLVAARTDFSKYQD